MRALILSDIHGNLEALKAVLAAAQEAGGWDELWNLGDMVGYGASPNEVLDVVRPLNAVVVRGNHDRVCCGLTSPTQFNPVARAAAMWTRQQLSHDHLLWLRALPQGPVLTNVEGVACVHGSPLDEDQYILTMRDAWAPLQQNPSALTFFGHTHVQGGFSQQELNWHDIRMGFAGVGQRSDETSVWVLPLLEGTRHLVNPGSVGQPRDHDWRAAFAVYDSGASGERPRVTFHRIPYEVGAAQAKILEAGLPERLAVRLREGR
jgi:diadenosine tetraphosphatase ApaH/serine/threonine PP2A family protein phosphatase